MLSLRGETTTSQRLRFRKPGDGVALGFVAKRRGAWFAHPTWATICFITNYSATISFCSTAPAQTTGPPAEAKANACLLSRSTPQPK